MSISCTVHDSSVWKTLLFHVGTVAREPFPRMFAGKGEKQLPWKIAEQCGISLEMLQGSVPHCILFSWSEVPGPWINSWRKGIIFPC